MMEESYCGPKSTGHASSERAERRASEEAVDEQRRPMGADRERVVAVENRVEELHIKRPDIERRCDPRRVLRRLVSRKVANIPTYTADCVVRWHG